MMLLHQSTTSRTDKLSFAAVPDPSHDADASGEIGEAIWKPAQVADLCLRTGNDI
jgi:hypothetical protein